MVADDLSGLDQRVVCRHAKSTNNANSGQPRINHTAAVFRIDTQLTRS